MIALASALVGVPASAAWRTITVDTLHIGACSGPGRLSLGVRDALADRSISAGTRIAAIATGTAFAAMPTAGWSG